MPGTGGRRIKSDPKFEVSVESYPLGYFVGTVGQRNQGLLVLLSFFFLKTGIGEIEFFFLNLSLDVCQVAISRNLTNLTEKTQLEKLDFLFSQLDKLDRQLEKLDFRFTQLDKLDIVSCEHSGK